MSLYLKKLKKNLFASKVDTFITLFLLTSFTYIFYRSINWVFFVANWDVVTKNLTLYYFGTYPSSQLWRPTVWLSLLLIFTLFTLWGPKKGPLRRALPIAWISMIPFGLLLIAGGIGLIPVQTREWGGVTLTIILTICSGSLALPIGVLLAIGRQSKLVIIQRTCRIYIDLMRAFPLIAVLFFGKLLIPLFLPFDLEVNLVLRAVIAFALFLAAYIAEDVRGGLQAIPINQKEAALALGLNKTQILKFILIPQALKTALPALTNQAIGLIQNTSLMAYLGLVELLGITQSILGNPNFKNQYLEVFVWAAAVYWIICTSMALLSKNLENQFNY